MNDHSGIKMDTANESVQYDPLIFRTGYGFAGFYGISTIVRYLMISPLNLLHIK